MTEIDIEDDHVAVECRDGSRHMAFHPSDIDRRQPDSRERIADEPVEAKGWRDRNGEYDCKISSVGTKTLGDWADRIRKPANREGQWGGVRRRKKKGRLASACLSIAASAQFAKSPMCRLKTDLPCGISAPCAENRLTAT